MTLNLKLERAKRISRNLNLKKKVNELTGRQSCGCNREEETKLKEEAEKRWLRAIKILIILYLSPSLSLYGVVYELECRQLPHCMRYPTNRTNQKRSERQKERERRKDKEATDHNQCSIERTKSFSETETKKRREAEKQPATGSTPQGT